MGEKDVFSILFLINEFKTLPSRKRLHKMICIAKYDSSLKYPVSFEFERHLYGPYSFDLKEMMDKLIKLGLIKEDVSLGYSYSLTSQGKELFVSLSKRRGANEKRILLELAKRYPVHTPLNRLVFDSKKFFGW